MRLPVKRSLRKGGKSKGGKGKSGKSKGKGSTAHRFFRPYRKGGGKGKKTGKSSSAAKANVAEEEVEAEEIEDDALLPYDAISSNKEWCLKGAKGVQEEVEDGASMILDTGCTKAMCSRHAYLLMREGLSEGQVELLPDSSTFNFANGQKALVREKCRIWFSMNHLCSPTSPLS